MKQPDCLLDENTSVGLRGGSPAPTGRKLLAGRSRELLRGRWRGLLAWCAVLAGLLVLALVIRHTFLRRHAWFVPINYDQASYLAESYACYDRLQHQGLVEGIIEVASRHQPTGALMPWLSTILFAIFGPGRMTAVTLNLFFFFGLQLTLAFTLRWASGRWSTTLYGLGLLLSALTPYFWAGGIMDLRLDFIVFCVYGIFLCLVLRSGFFQSWRWSLAAGGVAGFLAGFRYITGVYLAGFLVICFAVTLLRPM